jgi:hypothetical protein
MMKTGHRSRSISQWTALFACMALLTLTLSGCQLLPLLTAVQDAGAGGGSGWSGTITISRVGDVTRTTGEDTPFTETTQRILNDVVTVVVVNNQATGRVSYNYTEHVTALQTYDVGTIDITKDTVTAGSGEDLKDSQVTVSLGDDGSYEIAVMVPSVDGTWTQDGQSITTCTYPPPSCSPDTSQDHRTADVSNLSGASEVIEGQASSADAKGLAGSQSGPYIFGDGEEGSEGTFTITWYLARK